MPSAAAGLKSSACARMPGIRIGARHMPRDEVDKLKDRIDELESENDALQDQIDSMSDIISREDEDDDEGED
jgi:hypothetical protein